MHDEADLHGLRDRLDELPGVNYLPWASPASEVLAARETARVLVEEGVAFGDLPPGQVPWLVAAGPFRMDALLAARVKRVGEVTFDFIDLVQQLYGEGHPTVRDHLDLNVPADLRGLDLERPILTFRLDMVVEGGRPKVTEIEEVYGNAGKMHAMQRAYGVNYDALFEAFAGLALSHIYVDDSVQGYFPELAVFGGRVGALVGRPIVVERFSSFARRHHGAVWRFCYTRDFCQYPLEIRRRIVAANGATFVNPLFHGYGTKALLALVGHPQVAPELERRLGAERYAVLRDGFAPMRLLDPEGAPATLKALEVAHRSAVLKVIDCPGAPEYTWGSRGVFFGDRSAARWRSIVAAAAAGRLPGDPRLAGVRYAVARLVDSDRFDVPFLHPRTGELALLPRARVRLGPIFFRAPGAAPRLVAGHATFVNTSRKVHLGRHAVCAPLDWPQNEDPHG